MAPSVAGPDASRGQASGGRGLTTASGAPLIIPNSKLPFGVYYKGPAAYNPYFVTPDNHFKAGSVTGFDKWFQTIAIGGVGSTTNTLMYYVSPFYSANLEGGEEALRLAQQFVPDAKLVAHEWPSQLPGQPESYDVELPNGTVICGGTLLNYYYHQGSGVTDDSDNMLKQACGLWPTPEAQSSPS